MASPPLSVSLSTERRQDIAAAALAHLLDLRPDFGGQCGTGALKRCEEEIGEIVLHLAHSIATGVPQLLEDHIGWLRRVWYYAGLPEHALPDILKAVATVIQDFTTPSLASLAAENLTRLLQKYDDLPDSPPTYINESQSEGKRARRFLRALLTLQRDEAAALVEDAVRTGTSIPDLYLKLFQPVLYEVGLLWETNKVSVATEHYCSTVVELLMDQLQAQLPRARDSKGSVLVACAPGELHELGARMVSHLLQADGWDTVYLGANVPPEGMIETLRQSQARVLCLSMSMARHLGETMALIADIRRISSEQHLPIVVGGAVFARIPGLWRRIGADNHAVDALDAVAVCRPLSR